MGYFSNLDIDNQSTAPIKWSEEWDDWDEANGIYCNKLSELLNSFGNSFVFSDRAYEEMKLPEHTKEYSKIILEYFKKHKDEPFGLFVADPGVIQIEDEYIPSILKEKGVIVEPVGDYSILEDKVFKYIEPFVGDYKK